MERVQQLAAPWSQSAFTSLTQAQADPGYEVRIDDIDNGDLFHGRALDGTDTAKPVWEVVRMYRRGLLIERLRYRIAIAWDDRLDPALWP